MFKPSPFDVRPFEAAVEKLLVSRTGQRAGEFLVAGFVAELFDLQRRFGLYGAPGFVNAIWARAMFEGLVLPAAIERIRRRLASTADGDRQMVDILNAVLTDGLPAVEAACAEALGHGVHSADVVLTSWPVNEELQLAHLDKFDCGRALQESTERSR